MVSFSFFHFDWDNNTNMRRWKLQRRMEINIGTIHQSSLLQTSNFLSKSAVLNWVLRELVMGVRSRLGHFLEPCIFSWLMDPKAENNKTCIKRIWSFFMCLHLIGQTLNAKLQGESKKMLLKEPFNLSLRSVFLLTLYNRTEAQHQWV